MPDSPTTELLPADDTSPAGPVRDLLDLSDLHGWGRLSPREQKFARGLVAGLSQRAAAFAAGCTGDNAVVDVIASRMAAKASVRAVVQQALHRSGSDLAETIQRLARAQAKAFHDWENAVTREERSEAWRVVRESSALLLSLHARANITVSGSISHAHAHFIPRAPSSAAIPAEALPFLAAVRRSVIEARITDSAEASPP